MAEQLILAHCYILITVTLFTELVVHTQEEDNTMFNNKALMVSGTTAAAMVIV
jgi:hypothetical protein